MKKLERVLAIAVALSLGCGSGPYLIPGPSADMRAGEVTNDSLTLRSAVVVTKEPSRLMRVEIAAINRWVALSRSTFRVDVQSAFRLLTAAPPEWTYCLGFALCPILTWLCLECGADAYRAARIEGLCA